MLTSDGLLFIQRLILAQSLETALFDAVGNECTFPGYSRITLDSDLWCVDTEGNLVHPPATFVLHAKEYTEVYHVCIMCGNTKLSIDSVEKPYSMRYFGDQIVVNVKLDINKS